MHNFTAKQHALFSSLDNESKKLKGTVLDQTEKCYLRYRCQQKNIKNLQNRTLKHMLGKESIFKKPELPLSRCLPVKAPEYHKNPHKWKKYSLLDVDISDQSNTTAALVFLKQIDDQRIDSSLGASEEKIEFKKSSKILRGLKKIEEKEISDIVIDQPKFKGSKLVMPEYIIGQKRIIPKTRKSSDTQSTTVLMLTHLYENNEDG